MAMSMGGAGRVPGGFAQIYLDQMFNLGGAAVTSFTNMNSRYTADGSGSYKARADGALISIIVEISPQAASSLAQNGRLQLSCTLWTPVNTLTIAFTGFGLATAPQAIGGTWLRHDFNDVYLPVNTGIEITGQITYDYSPVTPYAAVVGRFGSTKVTAK